MRWKPLKLERQMISLKEEFVYVVIILATLGAALTAISHIQESRGLVGHTHNECRKQASPTVDSGAGSAGFQALPHDSADIRKVPTQIRVHAVTATSH